MSIPSFIQIYGHNNAGITLTIIYTKIKQHHKINNHILGNSIPKNKIGLFIINQFNFNLLWAILKSYFGE